MHEDDYPRSCLSVDILEVVDEEIDLLVLVAKRSVDVTSRNILGFSFDRAYRRNAISALNWKQICRDRSVPVRFAPRSVSAVREMK